MPQLIPSNYLNLFSWFFTLFSISLVFNNNFTLPQILLIQLVRFSLLFI